MDDHDDIRYFAGETTVTVWLATQPQRRRVFNKTGSNGEPDPLFIVTRALAAHKARTYLGLFVREGVDQDALETACKRYCTRRKIRDWDLLDHKALAPLSETLQQFETTRQVARMSNPIPAMGPAPAREEYAPPLLEE